MRDNGQVADPANVAATVEWSKMVLLLGAILAEARSEIPQIAVTDENRQEMVLEHWPVTGMKRVLVRRTGNGTDGTTVPTSGTLLTGASEGRVGMTWINSGANAVILYLSDQQRKGVPCVWLAASGGAWDGRFGSATWAGNVFAVAQTGSTTLVGGEF